MTEHEMRKRFFHVQFPFFSGFFFADRTIQERCFDDNLEDGYPPGTRLGSSNGFPKSAGRPFRWNLTDLKGGGRWHIIHPPTRQDIYTTKIPRK